MLENVLMKMLLILFILLIQSVQASALVNSDHFDGKKYFNPTLKEENGFWDVIKWKFTADSVKWEEQVDNKTYPAPVLTSEDKTAITFINHATFLIQLKNLTILTDPIFSQRASPFNFWGPKRARAPGMDLEMLPPIDVVIISHNHYDHMDLESLKRIDGKFHPLFLVPMGDEKLLLKEGIQNVHQMDWWQMETIKGTNIAFTPAQHWSARGLFDRYESLWGSYYIEHEHLKIYFAGDTGYGPHFKQIKDKLGAPDVALLPIGAYEPRWFMKMHHLNPEDAITAHFDLGTKYSIGMHFGTFQLTDEGREQPVQELEIARTKHDIDPDHFMILDQGETKKLP
jgi:L-ascorbate metabolism protein UlaG (beta-lactamase superfamily)